MGAEPGEHTRRVLSVDVWSDVMCPFCYIGDTVLQDAIVAFPHAANVEVSYRSYQLMPHLPTDGPVGIDRMLSTEKGLSAAQAEEMNARVAERGKDFGLDFQFDRALATNTRTAHRLIHFATQSDRQHSMVERLFRALFTDGLDVGDHQVLAGLAADVGLDRRAAREMLAGDDFGDVVDADIARATELGISGVPFFVFGNTYAMSGAQPVDVFARALQAAWDNEPEPTRWLDGTSGTEARQARRLGRTVNS